MENNIDKKMMTFIKMELKKKKEIVILHIPTNEEVEYLKKYGIIAEIIDIKCKGLFCDYYTSQCGKYYLN